MIKKAGVLITALIALSLPLTGNAAVQLTNTQDVSQYLHMEDVGVSGQSTAEDAEAKVAKLAKEKGADFYRIIRLTQPGQSSLWSATAVLYKKP